MNKKILIASLFATLMLLVPMTSVVGFSDVSLNRKIEKIEDNNTITETYDNEDCGCEVVSSQRLVRLERLLNRVKIYTNVISILSKNNPDVKEKCKELLNEVSALREMNNALKFDFIFENDRTPFICDIIEPIFYALGTIVISLGLLYEYYCYDGNSILCDIIVAIMSPLYALAYFIVVIGLIFDCDFPQP